MATLILYLLLCTPLPLYAPTQYELIVGESYTAHRTGNRVFLYGDDFLAFGEVRDGVMVISWRFVDGTEFATRMKGWPE